MNRFSELNTSYFRVDVHVREIKPSGWEASGQVIRNDTNEPVQGGSTVFDEDRETALEKLYDQLKNTVQSMGKPYDWENPDKVRQMISTYIQYNEQLTNRYMALEDARSKNTLTKDALHKAYHPTKSFLF